ncbi:hypothetical protein KJ966_27135 [bacterium]|nr:hypothetical protein [bacterium]
MDQIKLFMINVAIERIVEDIYQINNVTTGYRMKSYQKTQFTVLAFLLIISAANRLNAFESRQLTENSTSKVFKHWNTEKKEITGYTILTYEHDLKNQLIKEHSKNQKKDRTVFMEKELWFTSSGKLIRYEEIDIAGELKTINIHNDGEIKTEVWEKGERTDFSMKPQPGLIPFEVITLYLQTKVPVLLKERSINFTIYLPIVAIELKKEGLPTSFSVFEVSTTVSKINTEKTVLGNKEVVTVQVRPTSILLAALLPKEKSVFEFSFLKEAPHDLIMFKEGKTQIILESVE